MDSEGFIGAYYRLGTSSTGKGFKLTFTDPDVEIVGVLCQKTSLRVILERQDKTTCEISINHGGTADERVFNKIAANTLEFS